MRCGSLFSGIGGLDLGLERAGMTIAWQCEVDEFCRRVLAKHWPDVPCYGDVREVDWSEVESVELVCGGFPCQPVSQVGHKRVHEDERWLWPAMAAVVRELRPRYVLVENVADLVVRGMGDVLGDLAACGYDTEWQSVPAALVGAPHRRERIFIMAYRDGFGLQAGPRLFVRGAGTDGPGAHGQGQPWGSHVVRGTGGRVRVAPPPGVLGVADGFPSGMDVDRLRAVGNAVVPQVAEWVGRRILELESREVAA